MPNNSDWLDIATDWHRQNGVFLLPWDGYSQHFSEPLVIDYFNTRLAGLVVRVEQEQSVEVGYLTWKLAMMRADAGIGQYGLN